MMPNVHLSYSSLLAHPDVPELCISPADFEGRQLKLNVKMTNTGRCSTSDKCLCFAQQAKVGAIDAKALQPEQLLTSA